MSWVHDQESAYWRILGWEIEDFYDDDVAVYWRIARKVVRQSQHHGISSTDVFGTALMGLGAAMLVPGPLDAAAAGIGVAVFKHPAGAIAGVVAYNLLALATIGIGYGITTIDD